MMRRVRVSACACLVAVLAGEPLLRAQAPSSNTQTKDPQKPPVVIIGGDGGGGSGGGAAGGSGGGTAPAPAGGTSGGGLYDGYGDINWNGPAVTSNSPLIFEPFPVNEWLDQFRQANAGVIGSVRREDLTYEQALFNIRGMFTGPEQSIISQLEAESLASASTNSELNNYNAALGMVGHVEQVIAMTLARHLAAPQDPTVAFNLANVLMLRGKANEAMVLLNSVRTSRNAMQGLATPFGTPPGAAVDYAMGYASMLQGDLSRAQSLLSASLATDPSLADASLALSLAKQALGGDGRKEFIEGILQAYDRRPMMYCGDKWESDPLTTDEEQNVGPPTDQLFDLSKGVEGVLPQLSHPSGGQRLATLMKELEGKRRELAASAEMHTAKADALYRILSERLENEARFTDLTDQGLADLMNEANACLKPLHRMKEQVDKTAEAMAEAVGRSAETVMPQILQAAEILDQGRARAMARQIVDSGLAERRLAIQAWDTAVRIRFRSWHKYATALALRMSDPQWQEYAKEMILAAGATEWMGLYVGIVSNYGAYLPASTDLYSADSAPPIPPLLEPQIDLCTPERQKGSVEIEMVKVPVHRLPITRPEIGISAEFNCDKIAVEMDGMVGVGLEGVAHVGAGGFLEASRRRNGDMTLFGGPKVTGSVGPTTGSLKDGIYVTFDDEGIKEIGTKIDAGQRVGVARMQTFEKDFAIRIGPKRPPRFDPKYGLAVWRNVR